MEDNSTISQGLVKILGLHYDPVGVFLYGINDSPAEPYSAGDYKSYCQALALAAKGKKLLLKSEQMGCKLGTSVLGFEEEMERYIDDGILEKYSVGLFATEEASASTIRNSTFLEKGETKAVLVGPLSTFREEPQVIVFIVDSEQAMWLLYAVNYKSGGRMDLPQSGGALGGCADITALPYLKGISNITFLGLGCRMKSAIEASHLMMGIPGKAVGDIYKHILEMEKPIAMLKKALG